MGQTLTAGGCRLVGPATSSGPILRRCSRTATGSTSLRARTSSLWKATSSCSTRRSSPSGAPRTTVIGASTERPHLQCAYHIDSRCSSSPASAQVRQRRVDPRARRVPRAGVQGVFARAVGTSAHPSPLRLSLALGTPLTASGLRRSHRTCDRYLQNAPPLTTSSDV